MILGCLVMGLVGLLCVALGLLIWKKQRITLLHEYHYRNVSEADRPAFCKLTGWGILCIGAGILICAAVFALTESLWSFLGFGGGFILGQVLLLQAGRKYNRA